MHIPVPLYQYSTVQYCISFICTIMTVEIFVARAYYRMMYDSDGEPAVGGSDSCCGHHQIHSPRKVLSIF